MDEGFVEDFDPSANIDSVEAALSFREFVLYKQLWYWRRTAYLARKNDFLFSVKLAFFTMDAFDFGLIDHDTFRARLMEKVEYLRKYEDEFDIPFRAFEFICYAAVGDIAETQDIECMYYELYNVVFPE